MNYLSKVINDCAVGKDQQLHAYIFSSSSMHFSALTKCSKALNDLELVLSSMVNEINAR